jgi:DNA-3-methyladenine glycosylase II
MTEDELRTAGVSRQKAGYLRNVAAFALTHDLSARALADLPDEEVIRELTQIKGVGRWTVEMLLMFTLGRPDVLPVDDLGIQNAMKRLYRLRGTGRALHRRMVAIAENWRPHRTLVCRHLWPWLSA